MVQSLATQTKVVPITCVPSRTGATESERRVWTPLHHAVYTNQADVVSLWLPHGVDPYAIEGSASLIQLAADTNLGVFKLVCTHKHNSSKKNPWYLHIATMYNQAEIVEYSLSLGMNATETDNGWSLLHVAVSKSVLRVLGHQQLRQRELEELGYRSLDDDSEPEDVLQAANADRLRLVQTLLAHGADVNAARPIPPYDEHGMPMLSRHTNHPRQTALHLAAFHRLPAVIELLCKHGANPHAADMKGQTAIHSAACQDYSKQSEYRLEVDCRHLVDCGDDSYDVQYYKYDHLVPVNLTYQQTVDVLRAHGADVSAGNYQGLTALHCAARDENLEMLRALVGCGEDVNTRAPEGWTLLYYVVHKRNMEMTRFFIDAGADVSAKDEKGCTPLHGCAETYQHEDMLSTYSATVRFGGFPTITHAELAELLLDHGADPAVQNQQGKTPLDLAVSHDDSPLISVLSKVGHKASS